MLRRRRRFAAMNPRQIRNFVASKLIPPIGHGRERFQSRFVQILATPGRRFTENLRVRAEQIADQFEEFLDARVVQAVLARVEERVKALKADHGPGIGQCAASDAAMDAGGGLSQIADRRIEFAARRRECRRSDLHRAEAAIRVDGVAMRAARS